MHVDMDAFFASVEQRDRPELRGKPVVVGGSPADRGVVAAASYEARKFGIRSAMPMSKALRLCPDAVRVPPNFQAYRESSLLIRNCFLELTELVEPVALDEAYLDLTGQALDFKHALRVGQRLKDEIKRITQLTASVGIGGNKFLAKIASDHRKPDGLFAILPPDVPDFLAPLPIRVIPGIGPKTEERLVVTGVNTIEDLRKLSIEEVQEFLGEKHGGRLYELARGIDENPVMSHRKRKSLSKEQTFSEDMTAPDAMRATIETLGELVARRLQELKIAGRTISIKIRFHDFSTETRSITLDHQTNDVKEICGLAKTLLGSVNLNAKRVRLLGVRTAAFDPPGMEENVQDPNAPEQLLLW